jgi:hypothetical protein
MHKTRFRPRTWTLLLTTLILMPGCSSSDQRLAGLSQQACERQAEQNEVIARQTQQATELSSNFIDAEAKARQELLELQQQLVEADASAREELTQIQQDLVERDAQGRKDLNALQEKTQAASAVERKSLDRQREDLENERREIAGQRQRAPIIAAAIVQVGLILACLAPLVLAAYLLWSLRSTVSEDEAVTELLVEELVADQPRLLAGPANVAALPGRLSCEDSDAGPSLTVGGSPTDS